MVSTYCVRKTLILIVIIRPNAVNSRPRDSILWGSLRPQVFKRFRVRISPMLLDGKWRRSFRCQLPAMPVFASDKQQLNVRAAQVVEPRAIVQILAVPLRPWIIRQDKNSVLPTLTMVIVRKPLRVPIHGDVKHLVAQAAPIEIIWQVGAGVGNVHSVRAADTLRDPPGVTHPLGKTSVGIEAVVRPSRQRLGCGKGV